MFLEPDEAFYALCKVVAATVDNVPFQERLECHGAALDRRTRAELDGAAQDPGGRSRLIRSVVEAIPGAGARATALCEAVDTLWADDEMDLSELDELQEIATALSARPILA